VPTSSRSQYRWMKAVEHGGIKKPGLSRAKAAEFTQGQSYKKLPERAPKKKGSR